MLTSFTPEQLTDPAIAEADDILRKCVHCGFCTATCPTFHLRGDELDSPRGRIMLIKEMHEQGGTPGATVVKHLDRCLTCLSCMTTCPSGVDYLHLVEGARNSIEAHPEARPTGQRLLRWLLRRTLTDRGLFRLMMRCAALVRPLAPALPPTLGRLLRAAPLLSPRLPASAVYPASGPPRARLALLTGCAQSVVGGEINRAAIRLLTRHGAEVVVKDVPCCGALAGHLGARSDARAKAVQAVAQWWRETADGGGAGLDAVIITTSGCGSSIKDYGHLLADDPDWAEPARRIAALTLDVSEWLQRVGIDRPASPPGGRVAYHAACSLQHGQKQRTAPQALLRAAGFDPVEVPDGHFCCGSAGTYNILQPLLADGLKARKQEHIRSTAPVMVATGNLGCILQLQDGLDMPVLHTVQLLDWATGGPRPAGVT